MEINRGSEWRKWDLHVHSPYTFLNKYSCTDEEFIAKIVQENISCIGLTNYFKFEEREYELKKKLKEKGIIVFLNLELRLDYQNKEDDCLDLHIIFSNEVEKENLQKFLNNMTVNVSGTDKKLIDLTSSDDFKKAVANFDKLISCLNEESIGLKQKFLIGFLSRGKGNARSSTNYEKMTKDANLLIHSTDNPDNINDDRKFWLSYNMPLLQNSDAHSLESIGKKFTWIKANITFEGFKQILHEPEQRVTIQENIPDEKDKKLIIDQVSFISDNNLFTPETVHLNDNLNVIIGGKSSGKSILLYHIAKALYKDRTDEGVLKYFDTTENLYKFFYDDLQNESSFKLKVKLASGLEQSSDRIDSEPSILPEIKYIPQNHLSNLVDRSRKNGSTLKELIKELILEDPTSNERYKVFEAKRDLNNSEKLREIDTFFDILDRIRGLKKDLQDKGSKDILTTSIEAKKNEITVLQKDISEENKTLYNQYNSEIQKFITENEKIVSDYGKLKSLNLKIRSTLEQLQNDKNTSLNALENSEVRYEFATKYDFIENSLNEINEVEKLFLLNENKHLINDSSIKKQILSNNQKKGELQEKIKPLIGQKEAQEKIEVLQTDIQSEQKKLDEILSIENQIKEFELELIVQKEKIFTKIVNSFNEYEDLIADLKPRTQDIEKKDGDEIDIKGSTKFNFKKFKESIDNITDLRKLKSLNIFDYLYYRNLNNLSEINKDNIIDELKKVFDFIQIGSYPLIKDFNTKEACRILLENHFFDHWEVMSGDDTIHNMSTGKASFVLLKLIIKLSKSEAPILIDQPEDNLDNRSISTDLVNYLKDKKLKRQIILVTHNANIVVNADAENIIIANQKDENNTKDTCIYTFDYINGALEDINCEPNGRFLKSMSIRQHIADIVEGGEEAFKKREEKYGF